MKILLVQPESAQHIGFQHMAVTEPLGLEAAAASVPGAEVEILDLRLEPNLDAYLERMRPDIVGVGVPFTTAVYKSLEVAKRAKEFDPGIFTVMGGHHASLMPADFFLPYVDTVVVGECEDTFSELVGTLSEGGDWKEVRGLAWKEGEGGTYGPIRPLTKNLDATPIPNRQLTARYRDHYFYKTLKHLTLVETTRGCPYRCNFCSVWKFYEGRYRSRTAERVVEELDQVDTGSVLFSDDNFLHNVRRADRIAELLEKRHYRRRFGFQARTDTIAENPEIIERWRRLGLDWVLVGFESIHEEELAAMNKRNTMEANEAAVRILQKNGIQIQAAFIVNPQYDKREFRVLGEYIRRMKLFSPQITILTPLPGTDFFKEKWNELTSHNYELYDFLHVLLPTKLPLKDFYKQFCKLYRRVGLGQTVKTVLRNPFSFGWEDVTRAAYVFNNMLRAKAYLKGHKEDFPAPSSIRQLGALYERGL